MQFKLQLTISSQNTKTATSSFLGRYCYYYTPPLMYGEAPLLIWVQSLKYLDIHSFERVIFMPILPCDWRLDRHIADFHYPRGKKYSQGPNWNYRLLEFAPSASSICKSSSTNHSTFTHLHPLSLLSSSLNFLGLPTFAIPSLLLMALASDSFHQVQ